jgi:hypothetical protein
MVEASEIQEDDRQSRRHASFHKSITSRFERGVKSNHGCQCHCLASMGALEPRACLPRS